MAFRMDDTESDSIIAEINITPLTDVVLVLLIIFMITSSAMLESGLQVKLPSAKTTSVATAPNGHPIYVTVAKDGSIAINDKRMDENTLEQTLREVVSKSADKTVIIRGDADIFLGSAVRIMDAARKAGAEKIALATQPEGKN